MKNKKVIFIIVGIVVTLIIAFGIFSFTRTADIKKQLLKLEIQEEKLEAQYRTGEISFEEYSNKKMEIEMKEEELEFKEDLLEFDL